MAFDVRNIRIEDFDYPLPDGRIAKHPLQQRDGCKLLVRRSDGSLIDTVFSQIIDELPADAMLVRNNTRVINARLRFKKSAGNGATIEVFCLEPDTPADYDRNFASTDSCCWTCFVGNSKRWKSEPLKMPLTIDGKQLTLSAIRLNKMDSTSLVQFKWDCSDISFSRIISAVGEIPIPPYLNRSTEATDSTDYQTVYSRIEGSVAAPTAGLHFTPELFEAITARGIQCRELTLHVGAGTFQPVKSESIGDHPMHSEFISVDRQLIEELASTPRKVIAVGTTSVRTLESLYHAGCLLHEGSWTGEVPQWYPYSPGHPQLSREEALDALLEHLDTVGTSRFIASTKIIIAPSYKFRIVKGMVTNFHQPQSTLLLLVSAFIGGKNDEWRQMYNYALDKKYRFLSYGDAQLLL
ncbi:MAG: S-adenosylmethionine:tRNA ribosyltransferase-isomerase [Muribaculum sp.]|nr:S-adenosylmethionine:tRNA ribosyltransferase-isomerase [Muribaculaceae bacterium]MCM1081659.1 S-adenosylmethionine:tRNA ribosyltransferase-isomerase [Muribaculum sp.]